MLSVILILMSGLGIPANQTTPIVLGLSAESAPTLSGSFSGISEMGCIYCATNRVNGKCYVGKTVKELKQRKYEHESTARRGVNRPLYSSMRKYGFDAFEWSIICIIDDPYELYEVEQEMIEVFGTRYPDGYNLTDGGPGAVGAKISEETRRKLRESHLGQKNPPLTEEHMAILRECNLNREWTEESREKVRMKIKVLWEDPAYRMNQVAKRKGKRASDSTKKKMSSSQKKNLAKPEVKEKLSKVRVGNTHACGSKGWETRRKLYGPSGRKEC